MKIKLTCSAILLCLSASTLANQSSLKTALGKLIFHDKTLSQPPGQSCHTCHQPDKGFSDQYNVVSPGANPNLFGNRNAPTIAYVKYNPVLHWDLVEKHWVGGFFLDGRATNIQSQAREPFLNPLEMGNESVKSLLDKVKKADYRQLIEQLYGKSIWDDEDMAFDAVTELLVTYELGAEFAQFSSKYDAYLAGKVKLSALEQQGLEVFDAEEQGNCAACHPSKPSENGHPPLFTDYTYDNLGVASNKKLPFLTMSVEHNPAGKDYTDNGLADNPNIDVAAPQLGKFKVPTLRNIAKTAPYMHNGFFDNLEDVLDFYNTRDIDKKWDKPETAQNVNNEELGDLKLTKQQIKALLAFMETLSDGYVIPAQTKDRGSKEPAANDKSVL